MPTIPVETQDVKDFGRTYISISALNVAAVGTEALVSFIANKGGTNLAASTSYTVSNGKTFRITGFYVYPHSASRITIYRVRSGNPVVVTSPVLYGGCVDMFNSGNQKLEAPFPEGIEVNSGQQVGITHGGIGNISGCLEDITLIGFEY